MDTTTKVTTTRSPNMHDLEIVVRQRRPKPIPGSRRVESKRFIWDIIDGTWLTPLEAVESLDQCLWLLHNRMKYRPHFELSDADILKKIRRYKKWLIQNNY